MHQKLFQKLCARPWRSAGCQIFMAATLVVASIFTIYRTPPVQAISCRDIEIVFARGSGEALNGPSYAAWRQELEAVLQNTDLTYNFYELGSSAQDGHQYPAVSVSDNLEGYLNLAGAAISQGSWFNFGKSVDEGSAELKAYYNKVSSSCPNTKFVLGGYSQGAMLTSRILNEFDAEKIIYVATFGDPKIYLPEGLRKHSSRGALKLPDACYGKNLSEYRIYVPDCHAYSGVLGSYRPYQPSDFAQKLGTWCNAKDIMCSSGMSVNDHVGYVSNNLYYDAALTIAKQIRTTFPEKFIVGANLGRMLHEVAFVIDSTGSMSDTISQYVSEAKKLANTVLAQGGKVALFEYRDLKEDYQTKMRCDFSCSKDDFANQLATITTNGGGDTNESALSAILTAFNSLNWSNGATKSVVLLTDAGYHATDRDGTTLDMVTQRSLEIDPVNVYVVTNAANQSTYQQLATSTGGEVFDIRTGLTLSTETVLERPIARLDLAEYYGEVGEEFTFDASLSFDQNGDPLTFDWDLDGDGSYELTNAASYVGKRYASTFDGYITVRITNSRGKSSTMTAHVQVLPSGSTTEILTSITDLRAEVDNHQAKINFSTNADKVLLVVNDAILGFVDSKSGQGTVTLNELDEAVQVTLVPYSKAGRRGISDSITISSTATPTDYSSSSGSSATGVPAATALPKVPNSGIRRRQD